MMKQFKPIGRKQLTAEWQAAQHFRPELIIYHPKAIAAPHIAEKLSLSCRARLALAGLHADEGVRKSAGSVPLARSLQQADPQRHGGQRRRALSQDDRRVARQPSSILPGSRRRSCGPGQRSMPTARTSCPFPPTGRTMSRSRATGSWAARTTGSPRPDSGVFSKAERRLSMSGLAACRASIRRS